MQRPADVFSPLSLRITLGQLLRHADAPGVHGVWIDRDPGLPEPRLPLAVRTGPGTVSLLIGHDLAALAARTARILVRRGPAVVTVTADQLRSGRGLEIAGADGRRSWYPLGTAAPERVLADCLAAGRAVASSRVVYSVDSPRSPPLG
jgi:hypothetical protein